MNVITAFCRLTENACFVNEALVCTRDQASTESWFKQIYKQQELVYPKFHKMDALSQAGFLASELVKRVSPALLTQYQDDEIALLFGNSSSSAETDLRFQASYQEHGAPSPALFVYTLPNIVLGEIAIFNKWYGENLFVVLPKFAPEFFVANIRILLSTGSRAALCGWLEVTGDKVDVFVFLVEETDGQGLALDAGNLARCAGL
jgi:hypothetical protein